MPTDLHRFLRNAHILARLVEQVLERGYLRGIGESGVTFEQLNLLKFLARPGRHHVGDVAGFLNASNPAASMAVRRLVRKGLVRMVAHRADRRARVLTVTARARSIIRRYETLKGRRVQTLLRGGNATALSGSMERVISLLMRERAHAGNPCLGCGAYYAESCVVRAHGQRCRCD